jgi:hypothetical protein
MQNCSPRPRSAWKLTPRLSLPLGSREEPLFSLWVNWVREHGLEAPAT